MCTRGHHTHDTTHMATHTTRVRNTKLGIPGFSAPEVAANRGSYEALPTDVYSFGCVLACISVWKRSVQLLHQNPKRRPQSKMVRMGLSKM